MGEETMTAEEERTRLIGDIARVLREGPVPDDTRAAALTLIGWLARRMPGEPVSRCDISRCKGGSVSVSKGNPEGVPQTPPSSVGASSGAASHSVNGESRRVGVGE
jgi:glucose-6-phosphate dehydrogenase assembly protein OpcA